MLRFINKKRNDFELSLDYCMCIHDWIFIKECDTLTILQYKVIEVRKK